jgi:hypothetical protein
MALEREHPAASLTWIEHQPSKLRVAGSSPAAVASPEDGRQSYSSAIAGARGDLLKHVIATIPSMAPSALAAQSNV